MSGGILFPVIGPSGAGKDSLIGAAMQHFADDPAMLFPQRYITRPANAGGEAHIALSPQAFIEKQGKGDFAFHWQAHGLHYGLPVSLNDALQRGHHVVANVSRSIIPDLLTRYNRVQVLSVEVQQDVLLERLIARGREDIADIRQRLERAKQFSLRGKEITVIDNSTRLDAAEKAFIAAIEDQIHAITEQA